MKRAMLCVGVLSALVVLGGCFPEKRVNWSPDGRWAAVKGADGLYLCDGSGKLSQRLAENVGSVAWLPDSKHLVLSRSEPTRDWAVVAEVLPADRRKEVEVRAATLRDEVLAHQGGWDEFKPAALKDLTGGEAAAALVYVLTKLNAGLPEKLGEKWDDFEKIEAAVNLLQIATVKEDGTLELGRVVARSLDAFEGLRVSPDGQAVAYRGAAPGDDSAKPVFVMPLDGSRPPAHVADRVAQFPDWSTDSSQLVYATTKATIEDGGKELRLGIIAQRRVRDEGGAWLATLPDPEELAGIVFQNEVRVRCLRDGRILFATMEIQLPCTSEDMPQRAALFAVDPGRQPGVTRLVSRQAEGELPDAIFLFEVSPDECHVTVPGGNGRVAVLTLATGETWEIVGEKEVDHLRTEPSWRSADELCFAFVPGPEGAKERAAIALAKLDWAARKAERKIISAAWPEELATDFLVDKKAALPATQPAGQ